MASLLFGLFMAMAGTVFASGDNGLSIAKPESVNLDSQTLDMAVSEVEAGNYGDINSLLVLRNNKLVLEHYFSPQYHGANYKHPLRSVTKSVTSMLIGLALDQHKIKDINTKLMSLLPQNTSPKHSDDLQNQITLEHVLMMASGIKWDEWSVADSSQFQMERSTNWVQFVLDQPMSEPPGTRLNYSSGNSILLSKVLENAVGQAVDTFAEENLFSPIGVEDWSWSLTNNNTINTSAGLAMTRRDMARIGLLVLNHGRWGQDQVVSTDWVENSTSQHIVGKGPIYSLYSYAYHWWRFQDHDPTVQNLKVNDVYFAYGYGGQIIFVVPHLDMVVVSTGHNYEPDDRLVFDLIRDRVFPAVME